MVAESPPSRFRGLVVSLMAFAAGTYAFFGFGSALPGWVVGTLMFANLATATIAVLLSLDAWAKVREIDGVQIRLLAGCPIGCLGVCVFLIGAVGVYALWFPLGTSGEFLGGGFSAFFGMFGVFCLYRYGRLIWKGVGAKRRYAERLERQLTHPDWSNYRKFLGRTPPRALKDLYASGARESHPIPGIGVAVLLPVTRDEAGIIGHDGTSPIRPIAAVAGTAKVLYLRPGAGEPDAIYLADPSGVRGQRVADSAEEFAAWWS